MENPQEEQQRRLIRRVAHTVERLNDVVIAINKEFDNIRPTLNLVNKIHYNGSFKFILKSNTLEYEILKVFPHNTYYNIISDKLIGKII